VALIQVDRGDCYRILPLARCLRGVSLNYIKAMPSTAIGFTVYDVLKTYLGVQGHGM